MFRSLLVIVFFLRTPLLGLFEKDFKKFLEFNIGDDLTKILERPEVEGGSFGGGYLDRTKQENYSAIIMVHGALQKASDMKKNRDFFIEHGYPKERIFATTFTPCDPKQTFDMVRLNCTYAQSVRLLIENVFNYTKKKVNIIAFSMGSPIARKAILGGPCVEEYNTQMRSAITKMVKKFISVAGVNQGSVHCDENPGEYACKGKNGLQCMSDYMIDINKKNLYEGSDIFTIFSKEDKLIGIENECKLKPYDIKHATHIEIDEGEHDEVFNKTQRMQLNIILDLPIRNSSQLYIFIFYLYIPLALFVRTYFVDTSCEE